MWVHIPPEGTKGPFGKARVQVKLCHNNTWKLRREMECLVCNFALMSGTTRMAVLSALRAFRTLTLRKYFGTHFCFRVSGPRCYWMRTEETGCLKLSRDQTGNRNRNFTSNGAVSQSTAHLTPRPSTLFPSPMGSKLTNVGQKVLPTVPSHNSFCV